MLKALRVNWCRKPFLFLAADEMRIPIRKLFPVWSCVALLIGLVGCVSTQAHVSGHAPAEVGSDEAIAFVFYREGESVSSSYEDSYFNCTSKALRKAYPTTTVIPPQEFRRLAFPWMAGIRYLITVSRWTTEGPSEKFGIMAAGAMGFFFLGGASWERHSHMRAEVRDLKEPQRVGVVEVEASGRPWWAVIFIIPVGFPAFTETGLCGDLGEELAKFFAGKTTSASPDPGHAKDD